MTALRRLAVRHGSDKAVHDYCEPYERHLGYLVPERFTLLEIGVAGGASLRMWRDYFVRASIVGIDRNPACMVVGEARIRTVCDDASIPRPWRSAGALPSLAPLVVVDDGSHGAEEIVGAWTYLWPLLEPGGWYVVEDLATQWCDRFGGDPDDGSPATALVGRLLELALRAGGVDEFHAYREIAFARKGR